MAWIAACSGERGLHQEVIEMTDGERQKLIEEHRRRQPTAELRRKQEKASTKHYYTVEDIDLADAEAAELAELFEAIKSKTKTDD